MKSIRSKDVYCNLFNTNVGWQEMIEERHPVLRIL